MSGVLIKPLGDITMKKSILCLFAFCLALSIIACNTAAGGPPPDDGPPPEDIEWEVGYLLELPDGDSYPGGEIDLTGRELKDISNYVSVTVNATLYSDKEGTVQATTPTGENKNLAQFKLLKATGGWEDNDNICGPAGSNTKYNMNVNGDTTWIIPGGASGVPAKLLVQANWADFTADGVKVKSIKVNSIKFRAKISGVVGFLLVFPDGDSYPGGEIDLTSWNFKDISEYLSVTVNATLYTDEAGTVQATTPTGDNKNLAQFKLLKATGNWDDNDNICGSAGSNTKYNMNVNGDTTWIFPPGASGVPAKLLIQANWADFNGVVKSIMVNTIIFNPKTTDPVLDVVYGDKITVDGNKITFDNATYSDAAAIFVFPDTFPTNLAGKNLVISFTIPEHTPVPSGSGGASTEHQIHIQAANSNKNDYNGENPSSSNGNVGQKYITLDSETETHWDGSGGTIRVALNDLIAAANTNSNTSGPSPFVFDAIRICNNGTTWNDGGTAHIRCKSYTLIIKSVTVQ